MSKPICSIPDCDRPRHAREMCPAHYQRWRLYGDPLKLMDPADYKQRPPRRVGIEPCSIEGCGKPIKAREWCVAHWTRWKRHGSPTARVRGEVVDGCRICPRCETDKSLEDFGARGDGAWCRPCSATYRRLQRAKPGFVERRGKVFPPEYFRERARLWRQANPDRVRAYGKARRALKAGALGAAFDPWEVFERDQWTCGLCNLAIDPDLRYPDPASVSLDHVLPLSRGGEHSRDNCQAAHLVCNIRKGNRM